MELRTIHQNFEVKYTYPVSFLTGIFNSKNSSLKECLVSESGAPKLLVVIDEGVLRHNQKVVQTVCDYFYGHADSLTLCQDPIVVPGGESIKNDQSHFDNLLRVIDQLGLDRHAYIIGIGGGAVLDMVGFAASVAHRGIRHIRIPTTVLAQCDSGVGVKNGINFLGKKNFLGNFAPPFAVFNDFEFLATLDDRNWRSGIAEAIKVALVKDASFFDYLAANLTALIERDPAVAQETIYQCAKMHLDHIASGDPFEMGASRPLDFGHWAAHKLEQVSNFSILHGEAVAIGMAIDATYSNKVGLLSHKEWKAIIDALLALGFVLSCKELSQHLEDSKHPECIINGLQEFQQHIGGPLTIMLLKQIGEGIEVNEMNESVIKESIEVISDYQNTKLVQ